MTVCDKKIHDSFVDMLEYCAPNVCFQFDMKSPLGIFKALCERSKRMPFRVFRVFRGSAITPIDTFPKGGDIPGPPMAI